MSDQTTAAADPSASSVGTITPELTRRIDSMFNGDKMWAIGFVIALWLTYAFVFFAINSINGDGAIMWAMVIAGALVLLYNTASILAMLKHYSEDKNFIYSLDIRHLDEMRRDKAPQHHVE